MKYYMPTKLYSESGCIGKHSAELAALGSHALIITGKSSSKLNGSLDDVISALESRSVKYTIFDRVEENPSVGTVMAARDEGLACGADFVIGIGGGSPLDAAKAAALMMKNREKTWEFLYETVPAEALPLAAVPTTCGTGSEVTGVAVLTRHDMRTKLSAKHKVFPDIALIDGKYLLKAPRKKHPQQKAPTQPVLLTKARPMKAKVTVIPPLLQSVSRKKTSLNSATSTPPRIFWHSLRRRRATLQKKA